MTTKYQRDRVINVRGRNTDYTIIAPGHTVICDGLCNREMTESDETGGATFVDPPVTLWIQGKPLVITGNVAFCRHCAAREIVAGRKPLDVCPDGMAFSDWVRDVLREGQTAMLAELN